MKLEPHIQTVVAFIRETYQSQGKHQAVIAVSGGIDSAVALTLLTQALGPESVTALLLPYQEQSIADAQTICEWNHLPSSQTHVVNIEPLVSAARQMQLGEDDQIRTGNLMARARMMVVFDYAKKLQALVCGTENKSEHYLGYFTRFGDAASDVEPLSQWYKTQVRLVAESLQLPSVFLTKPPSAGLWESQSDETEMGFSYQEADQVLSHLVDDQGWDGLTPLSFLPDVENLDPAVVAKVTNHVLSQAFKRQVPYELQK